MLLRHVAKDMTSSSISWQKRYDFNAAFFDVTANENACYKRDELKLECRQECIVTKQLKLYH